MVSLKSLLIVYILVRFRQWTIHQKSFCHEEVKGLQLPQTEMKYIVMEIIRLQSLDIPLPVGKALLISLLVTDAPVCQSQVILFLFRMAHQYRRTLHATALTGTLR